MWIGTKKKLHKLTTFLDRNAGKISILAFIGGFIIDNLTLDRIDSSNNLILLFWLFVAISFIFINNWGDYREIRNSFFFRIYTFAPYIIQFAFGALFSGFVIYYSRSGSFLDSWPFLILIYFIFIANEKSRALYEKFYVQISILYFIFISFLIFYLPVIFGKNNYFIFGSAILLSLFLIKYFYKFFLILFPPLKKMWIKILTGLIIVTSFYIGFYIFNLLPPVPLSAKNIDVLNYVEKVGPGEYEGLKEKQEWYQSFWDKKIHIHKGDKIYVFSSIFAPTNFKSNIFYKWYWFNPKTKKWELMSQYKQKILGGRDNGFRSWSYIHKSVKEGKWRVYLLTEDGKTLDRIDFEIKILPKNQSLNLEKIKLK